MTDLNEQRFRAQFGLEGEFVLPSSPNAANLPRVEDVVPASRALAVPEPEKLISKQDILPEIAELIERRRAALNQPETMAYDERTDFELLIKGTRDRVIFSGDVPRSDVPQLQLLSKIFAGSHNSPATRTPKAPKAIVEPQPIHAIESSRLNASVNPIESLLKFKMELPAIRLARFAGQVLRNRRHQEERKKSMIVTGAGILVAASLGWGVTAGTDIGVPPHFDTSEAASRAFDPIKLPFKLLGKLF